MSIILNNNYNCNNFAKKNFERSFERIKKQDSVIKAVITLFIELFLAPVRIAQNAYLYFFTKEIKSENENVNASFNQLDSLKQLIKKNKPTIIKTALIGIGTLALITMFRHKIPLAEEGVSEDVVNIVINNNNPSQNLLPTENAFPIKEFLAALSLASIYGVILIKQYCTKPEAEDLSVSGGGTRTPLNLPPLTSQISTIPVSKLLSSFTHPSSPSASRGVAPSAELLGASPMTALKLLTDPTSQLTPLPLASTTIPSDFSLDGERPFNLDRRDHYFSNSSIGYSYADSSDSRSNSPQVPAAEQPRSFSPPRSYSVPPPLASLVRPQTTASMDSRGIKRKKITEMIHTLGIVSLNLNANISNDEKGYINSIVKECISSNVLDEFKKALITHGNKLSKRFKERFYSVLNDETNLSNIERLNAIMFYAKNESEELKKAFNSILEENNLFFGKEITLPKDLVLKIYDFLDDPRDFNQVANITAEIIDERKKSKTIRAVEILKYKSQQHKNVAIYHKFKDFFGSLSVDESLSDGEKIKILEDKIKEEPEFLEFFETILNDGSLHLEEKFNKIEAHLKEQIKELIIFIGSTLENNDLTTNKKIDAITNHLDDDSKELKDFLKLTLENNDLTTNEKIDAITNYLDEEYEKFKDFFGSILEYNSDNTQKFDAIISKIKREIEVFHLENFTINFNGSPLEVSKSIINYIKSSQRSDKYATAQIEFVYELIHAISISGPDLEAYETLLEPAIALIGHIKNDASITTYQKAIRINRSFENFLSIPSNPLRKEVTSLSIKRKKLKVLTTCIAKLSGIKVLDLSHNLIADIYPLRNLLKLESLDLSWNQIVDIYPLRNLLKLESLDLSWNQIVDIYPLRNLLKLESLTLQSNQIVDIYPLRNLQKLEYLNLSRNQIVDIYPLRNLLKLESLGLLRNQIANIYPLRNLKKLVILQLSENPIRDLNALKELNNLESLYLYKNPIRDLNALNSLREKISSVGF